MHLGFELNSMFESRGDTRVGKRERVAKSGAAESFDLEWIGQRTGHAERRQIVTLAVVFERVAGMEPEEFADELERRRAFIARVGARYGGIVERVDPDVQLLCWGWPVAHEADARLAVAAALDIAGEAADVARCGVDAGIAIAQQVSGEQTGTGGGPVGEVMRTAVAHAQVGVPGQVIVSETVTALVGDAFDLTAVCHSSPVGLVFIAAARRQPYASIAATSLIGRGTEFAEIESLWSKVCEGAWKSLLIEGVAGVGKSALAAKLEREVKATGGIAFSISCLPEQQFMALATIRALCGTLELEAANGGLGKSCADDGSLCDAGTQTGCPAVELLDLQGRIAGASAGRPILVIVEDLHWADAASVTALADLCAKRAGSARVLLLLSARPDWRARAAIDDHIDMVVRLYPLSTAEILQLIDQSALAPRLSSAARHLVCDQAEGNPFYALELARLCSMTRDDNAHHRLLARPNRINAALTGQLDALASLKPLAQAAAVLGRIFDLRVLAVVLELDERVLRERLEMLVAIGVLSTRWERRQWGYRFKHALLWSQAYGSVLKSRRRELHLRMARELERRHAGDMGVKPEVVAYHWKKAGIHQEAFGWWSLAAHVSAARGSEAEAIDYINEAMAARREAPDACTPLEAAELQSLLACQQQALRGNASREAIRAFEAAMELLVENVSQPTDLDLEIACSIGSIHLVQGDIKAALSSTSKLLNAARERGRLDMQAVALRMHGTANKMAGRVGEAIELLKEAVEIFSSGIPWQASRMSVSDPAASALAHLASAQSIAGDVAAAYASRLRALARTHEVGDAHTSSNILGVLALGAVHVGDAGTAAALARASQEVAELHGHNYWAARAVLIQAWARARLHPEREFEAVLKALEAYVASGTGRASVIAHCLAGEVALAARLPQQALELVRPFRNKGLLQSEWIYMPEQMRIEAVATDMLGGDPEFVLRSLVEAEAMALQQGAFAYWRRIGTTRAEMETNSKRRRGRGKPSSLRGRVKPGP